MTGVITIIVAILTGIVIIAQLIRMDRKSSRAAGSRDEIIKNHSEQIATATTRLNNHALRIKVIETTRFMTFSDHDQTSKKCRDEIDRRLDQNDRVVRDIYSVIAESEEKRQSYRDEDNKWRIDVTRSLAGIEKELEIEGKNHGRLPNHH